MTGVRTEPYLSSTARRLTLRLRADLVLSRQYYDGRTWLVVKDPVAARYFRFREEEAAVLEMLDGQISLDSLCRRFEERFAPRTISAAQVHAFVASLHRHALVVSDEPGQGDSLLSRENQARRQRRWAAMANLLALRFRGVDPDRFLDRLYPYVRGLFTRTAAVLALLLVVSAVLVLAVQFDHFESRLPRREEFFQARNLIWLAVALGCTKVLHELGHALACKHFGGECHELGLMLLVFTPCLYCNVSDAWLLPSKWQRAGIAAAGMVVELVLAAIATWLWWFTAPGLLNYLCLSVMLICSVSTLLINGNPLLRFDGYYILSNLIEVPNLAAKARAVLIDELSARCLGFPRRAQGLLPERRRGLFALYAVSAFVYRWAVLVSILWFLTRWFKPYGLEVLGQMLTLLILGGLVGAALMQLARFFAVPGRILQVNRLRLAATCGVVAFVFLSAWWIPLPSRVFATLLIEPRDAQRVYVTLPGVLEAVHVQPGQHVEQGAVLAVLRDHEIDLEIVRLGGQAAQLKLRLDGLERRRVTDPEAGAQIPAVRQELIDLEERLQRREADQVRLTLRAPSAGVVLPPAARPKKQGSTRELAGWTGKPTDVANLGSFLESETLFCLIGDPQAYEATLVVDQADVELVAPGQTVDLILEASPGHVLRGSIDEISEIDLDFAPQQLAARLGGDLQTQSDPAGRDRPASTSYLARVPLEDASALLLSEYRGQAKIYVASQTLTWRVGRFLRRTFHFSS